MLLLLRWSKLSIRIILVVIFYFYGTRNEKTLLFCILYINWLKNVFFCVLNISFFFLIMILTILFRYVLPHHGKWADTKFTSPSIQMAVLAGVYFNIQYILILLCLRNAFPDPRIYPPFLQWIHKRVTYQNLWHACMKIYMIFIIEKSVYYINTIITNLGTYIV